MVQVKNEGGLWDESTKLYSPAGGSPKESEAWWRFPSGSAVTFAHLEHDKNVYDYQGAQIPLICFDELCHFSEYQFWYMVSRNRSMCGVRPYIRATCNPDVDSWVATFIEWWIDQDTGFSIPERAGVLRWFIRLGEKLIWADRPEELAGHVSPLSGEPIPPKSVTFIPALLSDNKILMAADPGYLANLMALPTVERERLLGGNWKIRSSDAAFFSEDALLVNGRPVPLPVRCDSVFCVIDSALKSGKEHDGTAVIYCARSRLFGHPLVVLDWDIVQIEGDLLISWLPSVFATLEDWAKKTGARGGAGPGAWIEDKGSGTVLLQAAARRGMNVHAIDSKFTAVGKDERCLAVSGSVSTGQVKFAEHAFNKTITFKGTTRNHLLHQVTNFRMGDPDAHKRSDDALDTFVYATALALGNSGGF